MGYIKIYFFLKKSRAADGKAPMYCRVQFKGLRKDFSLKRSFKFSKWDRTKNFPCDKTKEGKLMFDYLKGVEQSMFDAELVFIKKRIDYNVEDILNIHNGLDNEFKGVIELFRVLSH